MRRIVVSAARTKLLRSGSPSVEEIVESGLPSASATAECPKFPCTAFSSQVKYRAGTEWLMFSSASSLCTRAGVAFRPSTTVATFPGRMLVATKISIETTSSVRSPVATRRMTNEATGMAGARPEFPRCRFWDAGC